ncbi:MAG: DNA-binding protein WhiA, partial [Atribacterota bacterium]
DPALIKKCLFFKKNLLPELTHSLFLQEREGLQQGFHYVMEFPVSLDVLFHLGLQDDDLPGFMQNDRWSYFLRGVFESRGYVGDPQRGYQLEFQLSSEYFARHILQVLIEHHLTFHSRNLKGEVNVYTRQFQSIADFLQLIGATSSYMEIEKIMVEKSTMNELTRWVNYETANVEKTVVSSARQRKKIGLLQMELIPFSLREVMYLRLKYPCASLREIGELCAPPLSKAEVHRRLKYIEKIADQKGGLQGE